MITEFKTVVSPAKFPEVLDEKMNKARKKFAEENKTVVNHHFTAAGGILMCVFEVIEAEVVPSVEPSSKPAGTRRTSSKAGKGKAAGGEAKAS